jgi:hypothetical protein
MGIKKNSKNDFFIIRNEVSINAKKKVKNENNFLSSIFSNMASKLLNFFLFIDYLKLDFPLKFLNFQILNFR